MSETPQESSDAAMEAMLETFAERVRPVIEERTEAALADLPLAKALRRPALAGDAGRERDAGSATDFFRAVLTGDRVRMKALSGGDDTAGGHLVPAGFRDEVLARLPQAAELAPHVRTVPVRTETGSLPSLATDLQVTWRAGGSAENQLFAESDPVLGAVAWSLKRADAITKISRELVADARPSVVEFVTRLFREAIAAERDRVIAVGNGSSEPYGLYSAAGMNSVSVSGAVTFDALVAIEQSLGKKYRTRARWVMNGTNLRRIRSLTDSQDRPLFLRDVVNGTPEARILGYPVSQEDHLPDDAVFFGDLSFYLWFDREEMGIESTTLGGDAFEKHQVWVKVWERADGRLGLPEAFSKGTGITG